MKKSLLFIILPIFFLSSCKDDLDVAFDETGFYRNKNKWKQLNIKDYSFEYYTESNWAQFPCTIIVHNDKIQEIIPKYDSFPYSEDQFQYYMTIDDIFTKIETIYKNPIDQKIDKKRIWYCHEIVVEYDEKYFFPKLVIFNYRGNRKYFDICGGNNDITVTLFEVEM